MGRGNLMPYFESSSYLQSFRVNSVAQKSFSLPESVLDKSKACFRRLQNSPAAQTDVIADLTLRQDLYDKTLSIAAQMDIFEQQGIFNSAM